MRAFEVVVGVAVLFTACTTPPSDPMQIYTTPSVPMGGTLLEVPAFDVPAGAETQMCFYSSIITTAAVDYHDMETYQFNGAHHLALNYVTSPHAVGMHPCDEQDMIEMRLVGANGGEAATQSTTTATNHQNASLPAGVGIRIPAGVQLVAQSHYLNLTTHAIPAHDALVINPVAPGAIQQLVDNYAIGDAAFSMPPHANYGRTMECVLDADMSVISASGHTHQYGTHLRMQQFIAGQTTPVTLYDEVAGVRLQNNAPSRDWPLASPLVMHAGDRLRIDCDWFNSTDHTMEFPEEMCGGMLLYFPARGFLTCQTVIETRGAAIVDAGAVDGSGNGGCTTPPGPSDPCVRPCNTGNELGVGKYCSPGGGQCNRNMGAILCTADFGAPGAGFCTRACSDDSMCGSGAVCHHDPMGSGCVPVACEAMADAGSDASVTDASSAMDASAE